LSLSLEFCEQQALKAASAAAAAVLDNVRERELRSVAAWEALAAQVRAVKEGRNAIQLARAEIVEDEAQALLESNAAPSVITIA
jgi:hypothetical protein